MQAVNEWSNLSKIVYKRTYARELYKGGPKESWNQTVDRVVRGNTRLGNVSDIERDRLNEIIRSRKGGPAGRGYWMSGSQFHLNVGGTSLNNCWFLTADAWQNFVIAQDLLMLGGGVGLSVEHRFVSKLPKVKNNVWVEHKPSKDADFIVPDSREGWCELTRRVLEAYFVTGKSFTYSTVCIRGYGEPINGFGGVASGPLPLIKFVENVCAILAARGGKHIRPIDAGDILCCIGEMVVAGNVRRSAIILIGDAWDKEYLKAKRWELGSTPNYRAFANFSVVADDVDDLHPLFWKTYENGEPFGLVNRKNIQKFGRMGEPKKDSAIGTNPCAEATLECYEPCNLFDIPMMNLSSEEEFIEVARLGYRYAKRVCLDKYHIAEVDEVVHRNFRVGVGITGCLGSTLFNPTSLSRAYEAIQEEDRLYSTELGVPLSIRTTVIKPSGTVSKMYDQQGYEGVHPAYSRYIIQRIRFAANDPLIPLLRAAGHHIEPVLRFDGTFDQNTLVVDFYVEAPDGYPVADEDWDTWKQLDTLKMAQRYWADQAVSVTVYYKRDDLPKLKQWLHENWSALKTISFLCHSDHGFKQAPKEAITKAQFQKLSTKVKPIDVDQITGDDLESQECEGACPIK